MPELPEVETLRLALSPLLIGRCVVGVKLRRRDVLVVPGDPRGGFSRQRPRGAHRPRRFGRTDLLLGSTMSGVLRHGKQLAFVSSPPDERALVVQLGMSGQLLMLAPGERANSVDHIHAEWRLDNGARLAFRDPRRFGGLRVFRTLDDLHRHWGALGPDALSILPEQLAAVLGRSRRSIKAALLDQAAIAGVGNIYADESLFASGIRPGRRALTLTSPQFSALAAAIRSTLAGAIAAGGSTLRDYVQPDGQPGGYQSSHRVYGRGGQPCVRCSERLRSGVLAQRTTVWCRRCQV